MTVVRQTVEARARTTTLRRGLPLVLIAIDTLMVYCALLMAYWIRYSLKIGPHIREQLSFSAYQPLVFLLAGAMIPVLLTKGAYRARLSTEMVDEAATVFSASTIAVAAVVVITAMAQEYQYSRGVIVYVWILIIGMVTLGRLLFRWGQSAAFRRGWGVRRLLVVGATDVAKMVMQSVEGRRDLGYQLVGFVADRDSSHLGDFGRFRGLGTVADIPMLVEQKLVDEVLIALPASAHEEVWPVLSLCERHGVPLKLVPDLFEMSLSRVEVDDIAGIPVLDVQERPLRRVARASKRILDVAVSLAIGILSLPVLSVLALLIRIESPGSPFLWQERVGQDGKLFRCLKLRTMRSDAADMQQHLEPLNETAGPLFKIRDDPRCTRLGRRMRRWSADELPQLWNVLRGDMSLVGPRPPLPSEVARYDAAHMRRLEVKPGMTGIWQVSGRSELSFDEMVLMDIYYVDSWSLALDVRILIRTIIAVVTRHGAY